MTLVDADICIKQLTTAADLVELNGGKLRVVRHVNALVSELLAQLVHALQAAHHQHLQVQLRRYLGTGRCQGLSRAASHQLSAT